MLVTTARYERQLEYLRDEIYRLTNSYWELHEAHARLLSHLNLKEVSVPAKVELKYTLKED
jgi:hypothetical protein